LLDCGRPGKAAGLKESNELPKSSSARKGTGTGTGGTGGGTGGGADGELEANERNASSCGCCVTDVRSESICVLMGGSGGGAVSPLLALMALTDSESNSSV
jgi:hypothetical protein